jgi:hypothetical protein
MILLTSFFKNLGILLLLGFLSLSGCTNTKEAVKRISPVDTERFRMAVLPIENLSGTAAPLKEIGKAIISGLKVRGVDVLEDDALEKFMAKHRIRYVGGIDKNVGQSFAKETRTSGVLITSLELYSEMNPPKIALTSRLVSTGDNPVILWIDGIGLAGDDSPGILGLGLIEDMKTLREKAFSSLLDSLTEYMQSQQGSASIKKAKKKFRPKIAYRSPVVEPDRKYTVAVIPFFNRSGRKFGGEIMVLHFVRLLKESGDLDVIEPGKVRQQLLGLRLVMDQGVSLADADAISAMLNVDLIITGEVNDYQDYEGKGGKPKVDFTAMIIERKSREVVWSSSSYNEGDDGVFFFDWGRVNTAYAMASQMVRSIGKMMAK